MERPGRAQQGLFAIVGWALFFFFFFWGKDTEDISQNVLLGLGFLLRVSLLLFSSI